MRVLGINAVYHEGAAAIVVDGVVRAAVEEERFNRRKHGAEARVDNPDELPLASIAWCLEAAGVKAHELDAVCYSFAPALRAKDWKADPSATPGDWGSAEGEAIFRAGLERVPDAVSAALGRDVADRFHWVPHHLAHAASAYYPSGFGDAAILVLDGIGEATTGLMGHGRDGVIKITRHLPYPDSLGFLWEKFSRYLGFSEYDAAKVMGLACYGDPDVYRGPMSEIVTVDPEGLLRVDDAVIRFREADGASLEALFGPIEATGEAGASQKSRDIAATLQALTNDAALAMARWMHARQPAEALCLAGGVALNCQTNWFLKENGPYARLYIPPGAHDAGTAIGAALWRRPAAARPAEERPDALATPYLGPAYSAAEIEGALRRSGRTWRRSSDVAREAAGFVAEGRIVGWFQGRMELGPRALGHRSLVCDPRNPEMREILNHKVKHRESFRPFAPSVLEEHAAAWFDLRRPSASYRYMLFTCPARSERAGRIPAVVHVDGTSRVQTVNRDFSPRYHALISRFFEATGVPLVLNTSFNDSEPIVCSPDDALATFAKTRIDALAIGDYIVERPR